MARQARVTEDNTNYPSGESLKRFLSWFFVSYDDSSEMAMFIDKLVDFHSHLNIHPNVNLIGDTGYFRTLTNALLESWGVNVSIKPKHSVDSVYELHIPTIAQRNIDIVPILSFTVCQYLAELESFSIETPTRKYISVEALMFLVSYQGWKGLEHFRRFVRQMMCSKDPVIDYPHFIDRFDTEVTDDLYKAEDEMFSDKGVKRNVKKLFGIEGPVKTSGYKRKSETPMKIGEITMMVEARTSEEIPTELLIPVQSIKNFVDSIDVGEIVGRNLSEYWTNEWVNLRLISYMRRLHREGAISIDRRSKSRKSPKKPIMGLTVEPDCIHSNWKESASELKVDLNRTRYRESFDGSNNVGTVASQSGFTHSSDYSSVRALGQEFTFAAMQAAAMKLLNESYPHPLRQDTILAEIQSRSKQLRNVFRPNRKLNPAWRTLVVPHSSGVYCLNARYVELKKTEKS